MTAPTAPAVPEAATGVTAFRITGGERGRQCSTVEAPSGRITIELFVRRGLFVGHLTVAEPGSYAVVDVVDDDGNVLADYGVPNAAAFRWVYRTLGLRVEATDAGSGR